MPVIKTKRKGHECFKVKGVKVNDCMTEEEAKAQYTAINIEKHKRRKSK